MQSFLKKLIIGDGNWINNLRISTVNDLGSRVRLLTRAKLAYIKKKVFSCIWWVIRRNTFSNKTK